ncbi:MAG: ACT domain-containing protein [Chthoniobacterales bacterium]|jgi:hypothetical protein
MELVTQLALFLENKPGTLAAVCDALAEAKINIFALTISDTVDHAVVRMVVSDTDKALSIFEAHGTLVVENEVLMIEHDNRPGTLSEIAKKLASKKVNIEYAYLAGGPHTKKGLMILRLDNIKKASEILGAKYS